MADKSQPVTDRLIDIAANPKGPPSGNERRNRTRHPYDALVALVLVSPTGDRGQAMILRAKDISMSGISLISRHMIYPGSRGGVQLMRSDGRVAVVGVQVRYCRYTGNMEHHTGLEFTPLPASLAPQDFLDKKGRPVLLDHGPHSGNPISTTN